MLDEIGRKRVGSRRSWEKTGNWFAIRECGRAGRDGTTDISLFG